MAREEDLCRMDLIPNVPAKAIEITETGRPLIFSSTEESAKMDTYGQLSNRSRNASISMTLEKSIFDWNTIQEVMFSNDLLYQETLQLLDDLPPLGEEPVWDASVPGEDEGKNEETFPEGLRSCAAMVDSSAYSMKVSFPTEATWAESGVEQDDTFLAYLDFSVDAVDPAGNITAGPLTQQLIHVEAKRISLKIAGNAFWEKMVEAGSPILPRLLSSLYARLKELTEKGVAVTLAALRKEVCKWVYPFLRAHRQNVAAHPEDIIEIPRNWFRKHGNVYPSGRTYGEIARAFGLEKKQVRHIFENARKRTFRNNMHFNADLKCHFSSPITDVLRTWQIRNSGKKPDPQSRRDLMGETGLSKRQIVDWFNNHKEGRNRSNKKAAHTT